VSCPGQGGGPAPTYTYDATNALTSRAGQPAGAFGYDGNGAETAAAGAQTRTAGTWNPRGQLAALTSNSATSTFGYAGESNKERVSFNNDRFQNTPLGVTARTTNNGAPQYVIREPNGTPIALRTPTTSYYFITDRQNSTISLIDAAGTPQNTYSYDPYGNNRTKTEPIPNPYQYIGAPLDTTGLYHLQNRYYDPTLGRFTQPDPSGQETNTYLYASGDPVNLVDPTGLVSACAISVLAIIGGAFALIAGLVSVGTGVGAGVGFIGAFFGATSLGAGIEGIQEGACG
jgi:RHS repeat-associated protein